MTKKIFRSICIVSVAVFLASLVLIMGVLYAYFSDQQKSRLVMQTSLVSTAVEQGGLDYLKGLPADDTRITWISADGSVLFDSKADSSGMENHLEREEIKEALLTGTGESSRYSKTLTERQYYAATRLSDGTVIRLSVSQMTWWGLLFSMLQPVLIVAVIVVVLSLVLAFRLSKRIIDPLNKLNLDDLREEDTYEELSPLVRRIRTQQKQLKRQEAELKQKKDEFDTATRQMNEGIILLNENGCIISINESASRLLGISSYCVGKDLLLFNNSFDLQELLRVSIAGNHAEKNIVIGERRYQMNASPVITDGKVTGVALIIFDITEKEKAEETRREFTANVSHELKTPLQTISGCAELMAGGMVKAEDVPKFSGQIYNEAHRMISLVDDIIKLSHLDEGAEDMKWEKTDIYEIASLTVRNLTPVAKDAGVELTLEGEATEIDGIPALLSGIVYNLCDNAIKYNRRGGSVFVKVTGDDNNAVLSVRDTGIGIPPEAQERIFERFYRVDKSRSKSVGGTGLGLSIVKHAAKLHNAKIEVHSVLDEGTTITVIFPKERSQDNHDL